MPTEQCYGVIVVCRGPEDLFLILQHDNEKGSWSFAKGHHEGNETPRQTALRELFEETAITEVELLDTPLIHEEYEIYREEEKRMKYNDYFVGSVKDQAITIQESEIHTYRWVTYEQALETLDYQCRKESLRQAKEYLDMYGKK